MKFLKHAQRPKICRKSDPTEDAENIPPNTALTHQAPHKTADSTQGEQMLEEKEEKGNEHIYRHVIIKYLTGRSETLKVDPAYFSLQPDITEHMRAVLLNWMIDVHLKYKLQTSTLFIAVQFIDAYLSQRVICRQELQLVGITALWIAAKYEETYQVPKLANLVFICDSAYTREQILAMEGSIIQALGFELLTATPFHYLQCLSDELSSKDYFFCRYLLEITLFSLVFKKYHPRIIAAAAIFFVNKLRKRVDSWPPCLADLYGTTEKDIKPCARDICTLWHRIQEIDSFSSLRSKYLSAEYKEVAKIRMGLPQAG